MTRTLYLLFSIFILVSCKEEQEKMLFELHSTQSHGINFSNTLEPDKDLNIFRYMYFYNGGGVATGDFNNDGHQDLFFTANQRKNRLYLNQGSLRFKDVSEAAQIPYNKGWSTGVSVIDINNDGLLDIYISQVGEFEVLKGKNQLLVCTHITSEGIPIYENQARNYGLDLIGFSTQAAFLDYDLDGDLDFFQLNHSVHQNGTFGKREAFAGQVHPLAGDRFFENNDGFFTEVSSKTAIHRNALGYGLGLAVGDLNLNGYPDMYIGNDFHENDYLYINQGNGSFKEDIESRVNHTSRFSMGVDIGDINNDLQPDIITLDMLPYDPEILKRSEGEDAYYNFEFKLNQGYNYQFARNNLQLNIGNGQFEEVGLLAGIHATDWSWSSLFADFNKDGHKDLFISNGINKRMNDTDYISFVSSNEIQRKISEKDFDESDDSLIDLIPEIKIPNKIFLNQQDLTFQDITPQIANNKSSFSNGSVTVDLDNDGDLDIVCNNINAPVTIYENHSSQIFPERQHLKLKLRGSATNINALGTKAILHSQNHHQYLEKYTVRGFQSSNESDLLFFYEKGNTIDSLTIIWPNNTYEVLKNIDTDSIYANYKKGLPLYDYSTFQQKETTLAVRKEHHLFSEIPKHIENKFVEFDREALIPFKMSTAGPALAVGDLNNDGLDDFFMGSARKETSSIYYQDKQGGFKQFHSPIIEKDSSYEDIDALIFDANNDEKNDLLVLSGGNEYLNKSQYNSPRLYLNKGILGFQRAVASLPPLYGTASCIRMADYDQDGDKDLFIGILTKPWSYGSDTPSLLLVNDGKGRFSKINDPILEQMGMVKDAAWTDIDNDKDLDLVYASEWGPVQVLINTQGSFTNQILCKDHGLWNTLFIDDVNGDGLPDILAGNHGLNSRFKTSPSEPLQMYINDFDNNGRLDQIITYYVNHKETIFADKKEIEKQLPYIRKKYNLSKDFARAAIPEVFGKEKFSESKKMKATCLQSVLFINQGNYQFKKRDLPMELQFSPIHAFEKSGKGFIALGNFYDANIQLGRFDASEGYYFEVTDKRIQNIQRLGIPGQVRTVRSLSIQEKASHLIGRNNAELIVIGEVTH